MATMNLSREEWERQVREKDTTLSFEDWLKHRQGWSDVFDAAEKLKGQHPTK